MASSKNGRRRPGRVLLVILAATCVLYALQPDNFLGPSYRKEVEVLAAPSNYPGHSTRPGVASGLHPGLVAALDRARVEAGENGHAIPVSSGFRSIEQQLQNLDEAIEKYGSREKAEHWVFPPERSMHVRGLAVDIGDGPSADWLLVNGHRFGICQTLDWEWWHFEWRESWEKASECPPLATSPAEAPPPDDGW